MQTRARGERTSAWSLPSLAHTPVGRSACGLARLSSLRLGSEWWTGLAEKGRREGSRPRLEGKLSCEVVAGNKGRADGARAAFARLGVAAAAAAAARPQWGRGRRGASAAPCRMGGGVRALPRRGLKV